MTAYNHTFFITLSADVAPIAAAIGRALDSDVGGDKSFVLSEDGLTISTTTPCTEAFYLQAQAMLTDPAMLHAAVSQDYATRWADLTAPTLAECILFLQSVITDEPSITR